MSNLFVKLNSFQQNLKTKKQIVAQKEGRITKDKHFFKKELIKKEKKQILNKSNIQNKKEFINIMNITSENILNSSKIKEEKPNKSFRSISIKIKSSDLEADPQKKSVSKKNLKLVTNPNEKLINTISIPKKKIEKDQFRKIFKLQLPPNILVNQFN